MDDLDVPKYTQVLQVEYTKSKNSSSSKHGKDKKKKISPEKLEKHIDTLLPKTFIKDYFSKTK